LLGVNVYVGSILIDQGSTRCKQQCRHCNYCFFYNCPHSGIFGENRINLTCFQKKITIHNYLTFNIKENKIYYIGDIVLNWTIDKKKDASKYNGGIVGAVANSNKSGEYIEVDIADNYAETTKYFTSKFPECQSIEKELLKVNK
jgi:hypothetical protein